ncbi:hypothetical protein NKR19_g5326 [Coniochaeta hoffmannii]|uniref:Uncharacterized protein n=1 Tax=Coniochaeta hoffmannii TaxID=91930 RepID=A0AA38VSW9_9PEZI|nr:hypothetical protein NKR19_g5326 [Coniochaeta hoffmannii]
MSAHRSTTAWDAETTMNLFACLLNEITSGAFEIRAVTDRMHAMGYTCTQKAVTHQFAKLKQRNKPTSGTAKSGAAEAIPSTPTKAVQRQHKVTASPAVAVQKVAGYTASRKRGAEQDLSDDDSDFLPVAKKRYNRVIAPATPKKQSSSSQDRDGYHAALNAKAEHALGGMKSEDDIDPGYYQDADSV